MTQNDFFATYFYKKKLIDKSTFNLLTKNNEPNFDCLKFLLDKQLIKESDKLEALAVYFGLPPLDMDYLSISQDFEDYFDIEILRKYQFVPVYVSSYGKMIVATSQPNDPFMRSVVEMIYDGEVEYILVERIKLESFLRSYQTTISTQDALKNITKISPVQSQRVEDEITVQNAPAVKFVDSIIKKALPLRASDIHIEPGEKNVVVRYRIDGDLVKWTEFPTSSYSEISARIKILANIDIGEKRIPQDGRISMRINDEDINFRVSTLPTIYGEKFVIRILDNTVFSYNLKQLNFSKSAYSLIQKLLKNPHGIILLTGPTGSGKTTTLYAFLRELSNGKNNIVTIEDPVEYAMDGINQLQVNPKANLTFASSLRSILRQDPDIIMLGEIRDEETAQIATRAAITGHLVLSTLHTNDAPGAVVRLVDMGIPQYLAIDAIAGVISQRLVKKLCPHCKKKVLAESNILDALNLEEGTYIYKAQGCPYCNHTGYKGRMAVHEILVFDGELRNKLSSIKLDAEKLRNLALKKGMITLSETCKSYVLKGDTSVDEYLRVLLNE